MEYSRMILVVEAAVREEARALREMTEHSFTRADVAARVLTTHPDIDRKRLERCIARVVTRLTDSYFHGVTAEEEEAAFDQMIAGIPDDTPAEDAIAIIERHLHEWQEKIERAQQRMYLDNLPVRALTPEFKGDVTFQEAVRKVEFRRWWNAFVHFCWRTDTKSISSMYCWNRIVAGQRKFPNRARQSYDVPRRPGADGSVPGMGVSRYRGSTDEESDGDRREKPRNAVSYRFRRF
jgi:hypothetical protein